MQRRIKMPQVGESMSAFAARFSRPPKRQGNYLTQSIKDEPIPDVVVQQGSKKFGREAKLVTTAFAILVAGLLVAWYFWKDEYLSHSDDLIYNLGLIGGIMMLFQFLYAMRKRILRMRHWGNLKVWFGIHTFIGLSAPTIIVIHSRFDIQSINGGVAFFSMLMVVFSGIIGRYLYSQINFDLNSGRQELKQLHETVKLGVLRHHPDLVRDIENQLKLFMLNAFANPNGVIHAFVQAFGLGMRSRVLYWNLVQIRQPVTPENQSTAAFGLDGGPVFDSEERRILRAYLKVLTRLARYNAYKQLFGLWRIGHVPVIYLLLITGLAHVLAVHMY